MAFRSGKYVGKKRSPNRRRGSRRGSRSFFAKRQQFKREKGERSNWTWAYQQRNQDLRSLGFSTYADYLQSETWKAIRVRVLKRDNYRCHGCTRRAFQVHHTSYSADVLAGRNIKPLVAICRECHGAIELDRRGNKLSLEATNARLEAIRSRHTHIASA
jgi:hypothetical protein